MAVTRIWTVRGRLDHPIDYAMNKDKTENQLYVSGINCDAATAKEEFAITKRQFSKEGGIIAYHGYQSFADGEVTADIAHQIGLEFASKIWGEDYQVVVTTHLNTKCIHNHFVINSVSFLHGKRCRETKWTEISQISDEICKAYGVSIVNYPKGKRLPYTAAKAEAKGEPTRLNIARKALDLAISESRNLKELEIALKNMGYETQFDIKRKYWTIRQRDWKRPIRMIRMGDAYTNDNIRKSLLANQKKAISMQAVFQRKARLRYGKSKKKIKRISGLRGIYLSYCYKLGYFKHQQNPKWVHYLYRDDLLKLHNITAEARLLCENKIDSMEELFLYSERTERLVRDLSKERKEVSNALRRVTISPHEKENLDKRREEISAKIKDLRRNLHLCDNIEARSEDLKGRLSKARQEEQMKDKKKETEKEVKL